MERQLVIFSVVFAILGSVYASGWEYPGQTWGAHYPFCKGSKQSPVDIPTLKATTDTSLGHFARSIFNTAPHVMDIKNNGHSLVVSIGKDAYTINNRHLLPAPYKLAQYHFHWGVNANTPGSEHRLNGHQYFGEMHLVHYNTKYGTINAAMSKPDGLAVLGFFLQVKGSKNAAFDRLLQNLGGSLGRKGGEKVDRPPNTFSIGSILPQDMTTYYRYKGSLTTPPCYESVIWSVFRNPIKISTAQANKLATSLHTGASASTPVLGGNFRKPQPLNGRKITKPRT